MPPWAGVQVELFTGDDIGSVAVPAANLFAEQAKKAGVDVKVTKKTPFYDDDYLSYTFAQDFWNTRNYIPQAVVGTFPPEQGGTYNETHWDNEQHRELVTAAAREVDEAKRADLVHQAQEIEYNEGGGRDEDEDRDEPQCEHGQAEAPREPRGPRCAARPALRRCDLRERIGEGRYLGHLRPRPC